MIAKWGSMVQALRKMLIPNGIEKVKDFEIEVNLVGWNEGVSMDIKSFRDSKKVQEQANAARAMMPKPRA